MMMKLIWTPMRSNNFYLADHDQPTGDDIECFEEADVAEALAVSWKEKRQELHKLQRARKWNMSLRLSACVPQF
jgi:hypothetical protein